MTFDEFWTVYPKKKGKAEARKAWEKVPISIHETILHALRQQVAGDTQFQSYTPNASTWLNQQRWEDEVETRQPREENGKPHKSSSTHDGQCMFVYQGARCPLPGNMSEGDVVWHCGWHALHENRDPRFQAQHFETYASRAKVREYIEARYPRQAYK